MWQNSSTPLLLVVVISQTDLAEKWHQYQREILVEISMNQHYKHVTISFVLKISGEMEVS